jgi:hypothetical protein
VKNKQKPISFNIWGALWKEIEQEL